MCAAAGHGERSGGRSGAGGGRVGECGPTTANAAAWGAGWGRGSDGGLTAVARRCAVGSRVAAGPEDSLVD